MVDFSFSGTVKENLDPVGFYNMRQISDVIKRCRLDNLISRLGGINFLFSSGILSENFRTQWNDN